MISVFKRNKIVYMKKNNISKTWETVDKGNETSITCHMFLISRLNYICSSPQAGDEGRSMSTHCKTRQNFFIFLEV